MDKQERLKKTQEELKKWRGQLVNMVKESQIIGQEIFRLEGEERLLKEQIAEEQKPNK